MRGVDRNAALQTSGGVLWNAQGGKRVDVSQAPLRQDSVGDRDLLLVEILFSKGLNRTRSWMKSA